MPYVDPGAVTTGTTITSTWGNAVRDAEQFLANPPACRVYNSAVQSVANGVNTMLTFNSERFDTDSMHSTATNTSRITINTAGVYMLTASISFAPNATGRRQLAFRINGATYIAAHAEVPISGLEHEMALAAVWKFAAADYVEVSALQTSGGALNVSAAGNYTPEFSAVWVGLG